jgi:hypothetical protein
MFRPRQVAIGHNALGSHYVVSTTEIRRGVCPYAAIAWNHMHVLVEVKVLSLSGRVTLFVYTNLFYMLCHDKRRCLWRI